MEILISVLGIITLLSSSFAADYNVTRRENYPYQVSMQKKGAHICGGTVYSPRLVLTAASCVNGTNPADWRVVTGNLNLLKPSNVTQSVPVSKYFVHEQFAGKFQASNIALVKLAKALRFDNFTNALPIARTWPKFVQPGALIVSGWGANGTQVPKYLDLHAANLTLGSTMQCLYYPNGFQPYQMFCAGFGRMENPCTGDLGGPLVSNNSTFGIVAWRGGCNAVNQPGLYTNVTYFADWILHTAKKNGASSIHLGVLLSVVVALFNISMFYVS